MTSIFKKIKAKLDSARLLKDTITMSFGQGLQLLMQAAYFVLIARTLGPREYGAFVAIAAMVGILIPFTGIGGPALLLKNVSREKSLLGKYWGNGLLVVAISSVIFTCVLVVLGPLMSGIKLRNAILCIAISELVLSRITELAGFAFTALGQMRNTALLSVLMSLSRLGCVIVLSLFITHPTVQEWCVAILCGSLMCSGYSVWRISRLAKASVDIKVLRKELREGAYFATGAAAATFYNDIDKTMLARMSTLGATGIYGAAYRIVDVAMAPIKAMTAAAYAETFRRGAKGVEAAHQYALSLIKRAGWIGAGLFLLLFLGAPALPYVIGGKFSNSVDALRWLALLPFLRSWHYFLGDALSGAGLNATRTIIQIVIALVNVGLNLYFIREWSWRGAAWTSLMCDGLLAVGFAVALHVSKRRSPTAVISVPAVTELSA